MSMLLQISERSLNRMADAGQIPSITLPSGERRFDSDQVRAWLRQLQRPLAVTGGISQPYC